MTTIRHRRTRTEALLCMFALMALAALAPARAQERVVIGVAPFVSSQMLLDLFGPMTQQLEAKVKKPVRLATAPDSRVFAERSLAGEYDFVIVSPHVARLLQKEAQFRILAGATGRVMPVIVVRKDSGIRKISDLRGKTVTLHDAWSLTALMGGEKLAEAGLVDGRDVELRTAPNMSVALYSVVYGDADAAIIGRIWGVMRPEVGAQISVLAELGSYDLVGVLLAHPHVPADFAQALGNEMQNYFRNAEHGRRVMQLFGFESVRPLVASDLKPYDKYAATLGRAPVYGQRQPEASTSGKVTPKSSLRETSAGEGVR